VTLHARRCACLCCVNIGDLRMSKVIWRIASCRVMLFAACRVCLCYVSFILFALTYASQSEIRGDCFSAIWSLNSGLDKIPPAIDYSGVYTRFLSPCTYTPEIKQNNSPENKYKSKYSTVAFYLFYMKPGVRISSRFLCSFNLMSIGV